MNDVSHIAGLQWVDIMPTNVLLFAWCGKHIHLFVVVHVKWVVVLNV